MIHIDICRDRADVANCLEFPKLLVQTSTDGGGWATQYVIYADANLRYVDAEQCHREQENRAADTARVFANGCRYAGAMARITMLGYAL